MDWLGAAGRWLFAGCCGSCGSRLPFGENFVFCEGCAIGVCDAAPRRLASGLPVTALWAYGGPVAQWIGHCKGRGVAPDLAGVAANWRRCVGKTVGQQRAGAVLVPVAPHGARLAERGFHLPAMLAQLAGKPTVAALVRIDKSEPRRRDRDSVVLFAVDPARRPASAGKRLWLVDDVVTTGATLQAAADALAAAGAGVAGAICLADARPEAVHRALAGR